MSFAHRPTVVLENQVISLTLLPGGGHIAAVTLKSNGVDPLWDPVWATIDPRDYDPGKHPQFGGGTSGKLLAGIAGHNLCFDFFGMPSAAEAAVGLSEHGEASVADWEVASKEGELLAVVDLPLTGMRIERRLRLAPKSPAVVVTETVENLGRTDRPVGWTEHVTLGPPFLAKGKTIFHTPATISKVYDKEFANGKDRFRVGAEFHWPMAPLAGGGFSDMRLTADTLSSGAYTSHLMKPGVEQAYFTAYNFDLKTVFGYVWKRADFPWLGIWEENHCRQEPPWDGKSLTRGLEFGVSPIPESRREMVDRGQMFGERCYRWIPARSRVSVEYCLFITESERPVESVEWGAGAIRGEDGFEIRV